MCRYQPRALDFLLFLALAPAGAALLALPFLNYVPHVQSSEVSKGPLGLTSSASRSVQRCWQHLAWQLPGNPRRRKLLPTRFSCSRIGTWRFHAQSSWPVLHTRLICLLCAGSRFSLICGMVLAIILFQGASVAVTVLEPNPSAGLRFGLMCGVLALLAATLLAIPLGSGRQIPGACSLCSA